MIRARPQRMARERATYPIKWLGSPLMRSRSRNRAAVCFPAALAKRARRPSSKIGVAVAAAIAGLAVPRAPVLAVDADSSASAGGLQEIIVTARKRTENLQEVPLSIDVFSKKDMQNLGISGFD